MRAGVPPRASLRRAGAALFCGRHRGTLVWAASAVTRCSTCGTSKPAQLDPAPSSPLIPRTADSPGPTPHSHTSHTHGLSPNHTPCRYFAYTGMALPFEVYMINMDGATARLASFQRTFEASPAGLAAGGAAGACQTGGLVTMIGCVCRCWARAAVAWVLPAGPKVDGMPSAPTRPCRPGLSGVRLEGEELCALPRGQRQRAGCVAPRVAARAGRHHGRCAPSPAVGLV